MLNENIFPSDENGDKKKPEFKAIDLIDKICTLHIEYQSNDKKYQKVKTTIEFPKETYDRFLEEIIPIFGETIKDRISDFEYGLYNFSIVHPAEQLPNVSDVNIVHDTEKKQVRIDFIVNGKSEKMIFPYGSLYQLLVEDVKSNYELL